MAQRSTKSPGSLELTPLRYFLAIAHAGQVTVAARSLRVSQPAMSVAIKKLEARLGTTLLLRNPTGVTLTAAGVELARHAEEVFATLKRAEARMEGLQTGETGRFTIGVYHSFGAFFLPPLVKQLTAEAPGLELSLWEGTGEQIRAATMDRTVDFGLIMTPRPHPELVLIKLFTDVMGVFASGQLSRKDRLASLAAGPLFHVERVAISRRVVDALDQKGLLPERVMACGDFELAKSLTINGAGASVLPYRIAVCNVAPGVIELADPALPHQIDHAYLIFRSDLPRTRAALRLKDALIARGAELASAIDLPL